MEPSEVTYAVARLHSAAVHGLHDAALLVGDIAHPVRLARRNQQVGAPSLDVAIQLFRLVDVELARVLDGARCAVVEAVVAVYRGVCAREQLIRLARRGELAAGGAPGGRQLRRRRQGRRQLV